MRYGSMVSAGCLALLSLLRLERGDVGAALLLAAVAVAALLWGLLGSHGRGGRDRAGVVDASLERSRARSWRRIALVGLAVSLVGAFTFPPMALVVGALTLYAAHRMRRSAQALRLDPARG